MTVTRQIGSSAARTGSQVSKSISIREDTGKRRTAAAGRAVWIYFDLGIDCKVPRRDLSSKPPCGELPQTRSHPPPPLPNPIWTVASIQWLSVLRDLQDDHCCLMRTREQGFPSYLPRPILVPSSPRVLAPTPPCCRLRGLGRVRLSTRGEEMK